MVLSSKICHVNERSLHTLSRMTTCRQWPISEIAMISREIMIMNFSLRDICVPNSGESKSSNSLNRDSFVVLLAKGTPSQPIQETRLKDST